MKHKQDLLSKTDDQIAFTFRYKSVRCFSVVDKAQLRKIVRLMVAASNRQRRSFLGTIYRAQYGG